MTTAFGTDRSSDSETIAAAVIAGSAHTASATPAPGVPTGSVDTTPVVTRVDVDGDLKRDTVRLTSTKVSQDRYTFRITVTTAKGKRAIRDVHVADYLDGTLTPADIWGGTAHLDGVRGAEIMVDRGGNEVPERAGAASGELQSGMQLTWNAQLQCWLVSNLTVG